MKTNVLSIHFLLVFLLLLLTATIRAQPADYAWETMSRNASESMPCGGGDIGMNIWAEQGDLFLYFCRSGSYDEHNTLLKQGRIRIGIDDSGDGGERVESGQALFRQILHLNEGYAEVMLHGATVCVWADVFKPVIHIEINSPKPVCCALDYENWRFEDRPLQKGEGRQNSLKWASTKGITVSRDSVRAVGSEVIFFHRNPIRTVFDRTVEAEGLGEFKEQLWNPLSYLTFGGRLRCEGLTFAGIGGGKYADTEFRAWKFRSTRPAKRFRATIVLHNAQTASASEWIDGLDATERTVRRNADRNASRAWWQDFWQRSYIEADGPAAALTRNYTLFRYMLGCNAYGTEPTKFNGGLFTFDPVYVDPLLHFSPDYRNWGGGTMTAQNQRLVYWPLLKSGDWDLMIPQFDFYLRMLPAAELRSRVYWGHAGGCFSEQTEQFGLPNFVEYGQNRPEWFDKGVEYNAWLEYEWDTVLEFCEMILESRDYAGTDLSRYEPLIESALTFFDEHYRYLAARRGAKQLDGDGKLILYPGSGCETYKMAYNAASTVAALQTVLSHYIDVKEAEEADATVWCDMLARVPEIPHRIIQGHEVIAPAKSWERINNVETPQLYPVFPWRIYSVAASSRRNAEVAVNTYFHDPDALRFRSSKGWKQDNIWSACLGLTDEAVRLNDEKLADGPHRFPAFWGPGFDWTPDHNWGGSGMIGLQEMLLQCDGDTIELFPAWPRERNVRFRLHAPRQTVVEAELKDGEVVYVNTVPAERRKDVVIHFNR